MNITYNKKTKLFHLSNSEMSYVIGVLPNGHLAHYYYGKKLIEPLYVELFSVRQNKALTTYVAGYEDLSLNLERLEYPVFGTSDLRTPAIDLQLENGSHTVDYQYQSYLVKEGKNKSGSLPQTFGENVKTLEIKCKDHLTNSEIIHSYSMFQNQNVIVRKVKLTNNHDDSIRIQKIMSMSVDINEEYSSWIQLSGDWARERHIIKRDLKFGTTKIDSQSGSSSAIHNPGVVLVKDDTRELSGEAIGFNLVYSGNFEITATKDQNDTLRVMAGINSFMFDYELKKNESFETPEVILAYSSKGLSKLSQTYHSFLKNHLINKTFANEVRPILLNNWEATYFNFNEEKLINLATKAKEAGIDLFVLDDGWFGKRDSDFSSLGDWFVNTDKLENGLKNLNARINDLGLDFGIWIEPEMVNPNSDLYRKHPDYAIHIPNRNRSLGRNQCVLDFSRNEVVDNIYNQLITVFDELNLAFLKWDMNRTISEPFSLGLAKENQGEFYHKYILGVYDLYERLTKRYPKMMIESCSAGGNRFDSGLLYYAPQAWTSDNTDAKERLKIQYGTSLFYPLSSIGSHVSAVPNHQTNRLTPLKFRNDVAMFGTYGFELDLNMLETYQIDEIKKYVDEFKVYQKLIHNGLFYRLQSPFENDYNTTWMVVDEYQKEALVGHYLVSTLPNQGQMRIKLTGLNETFIYDVESDLFSGRMSGATLMNHGFVFNPSTNGTKVYRDQLGDYQSYLIKLKALD